MQVRHPYEYSEYSVTRNGWRREGKKLSKDWVYVWALKNPKTGKIALVMSDCEGGAPTRVEPIETWYNRERLQRLQGDNDDAMEADDGDKWRVFMMLVDSGRISITEKNYGKVDSAYFEALISTEIQDND
jgi:hypothetical protein